VRLWGGSTPAAQPHDLPRALTLWALFSLWPLVISSFWVTCSTPKLNCFKKQTVLPPKTLQLSSPVFLVSHAACVPPAPFPWCWTPRLCRCPVVLARLLLSFPSSHSSPVSGVGEGSWELLGAAALVQGMARTAASSGDVTCQGNATMACVCRESVDVLIQCAKQHIFPYIRSQKKMSKFFHKAKREADIQHG